MQEPDFSGLQAIYFNGTLKKSPEVSNTEGLLRSSMKLMAKHGVQTELIRTIDHNIATGMQPDMREHGWAADDWPGIYKKVQAADIVVVCGPVWLGDNSSQTKKLIERLYANSSDLNKKGQFVYYGKVGGCIITGNEDGGKHCAMNVLFSLQHIGFTIPPAADAYWVGEAGPGPSYLDEGSGGPENDFTNRSVAFTAYNLMHIAKMLKDSGGVPAYGNTTSAWKSGRRFGFENPEYRAS